MRVDLLDFELPASLIASRPLAERDGARMLVVHADGRDAPFEDRSIVDLPDLIPRGAVLVVNNTRVLHARLLGSRRETGGKVELLLLRPLDGSLESARWSALGRASKPFRPGACIDIAPAGQLVARVVEVGADGVLEVCLEVPGAGSVGSATLGASGESGESKRPDGSSGAGRPVGSIADAIERVGHVPLPPYVQRPDETEDRERYQTVFASQPGAVAAPTAGLHLTPGLLARLAARDVRVAEVTLHVGLGTFRPVAVDDLDAHPMHEEWLQITPAVVDLIADARSRGAPVIAVGTTSVRALESSADPVREGHVVAREGMTRLLIQPGFPFKIVDAMLTNFHLPRSTLLALVGAFGGLSLLLDAYRHAVTNGYRFFSFGDAMFLPTRASAEDAARDLARRSAEAPSRDRATSLDPRAPHGSAAAGEPPRSRGGRSSRADEGASRQEEGSRRQNEGPSPGDERSIVGHERSSRTAEASSPDGERPTSAGDRSTAEGSR